MTYLFLGEDGQKKDSGIAELKRKCLSSPDAGSFDYDVFYADDLDSQTLQKALLALPAVAPQRLILIHACHKLDSRSQKAVVTFASQEHPRVVLALESNEFTTESAFVKKITPFVRIVDVQRPRRKNVFDMTRVMSRRRQSEALKILSELFDEGDHPLQIMGGLVWFWGRQRGRMAQDRFEEGLRTLQQADLNIKRSRLDPGRAVELAVVKLCAILG